MCMLLKVNRKRKGGELMEMEIIDQGKQADQIQSDCCVTDIWVVLMPDAEEA